MQVKVIDADKVARKVVQPGKPAWKEIVKQFGREILMENGEIDRAKLRSIVFSDRWENKSGWFIGNT